jgi:N-acetyl-anhydromuramyl-L-alanine amidase AmpD
VRARCLTGAEDVSRNKATNKTVRIGKSAHCLIQYDDHHVQTTHCQDVVAKSECMFELPSSHKNLNYK